MTRDGIISRHYHARQQSLLLLLLLLSLIFLHSRNHNELQAMPPILTYPLDTRDSDFEHVQATHEYCASTIWVRCATAVSQ
jgi:hypothetical protein